MMALVVDDDRDIVELVELQLRLSGWDVVSARSGEEAVALLAKHDRIDMCVADVWMRPLSGYDVRAAVEQRSGGRRIPVLFITGDDPARLPEAQGCVVLRKPFTQRELLDAIQRAMAAG